MTARELLDELDRLRVRIVVEGGNTILRPEKGSNVAARMKQLEPDLARHRSELLELAGSDRWDQGWAVRRMAAADAAVAASGVPGTDPEVQAAVEQVLACHAERDRGGLEEWCQVIEQVVRDPKRRRRP
ncbi:unnamed protein product [Gemmataceae bacterium]|nr:unnamed protein product [Gemmataceae bacterium]VTT98905.1 unnamed protein product [Gemmataceae bacterium]